MTGRFAQHDGPFDDVDQFADVAGPAVALQHCTACFVEAGRPSCRSACVNSCKVVFQQQRNVADPLAERRLRERDHVDAVVQVLAELALARPCLRDRRWWPGSGGCRPCASCCRRPASNSRSCRTRSSLTCRLGEAVAISSRKIVPPSACRNLPILS